MSSTILKDIQDLIYETQFNEDKFIDKHKSKIVDVVYKKYKSLKPSCSKSKNDIKVMYAETYGTTKSEEYIVVVVLWDSCTGSDHTIEVEMGLDGSIDHVSMVG